MDEVKKLKLGFGLVGGLLVGQTAAVVYLVSNTRRLTREREVWIKGVNYFGAMLDREGVELTEFDLLALSAIFPHFQVEEV